MRSWATFTLMAPEEQRHLAGIERFVGRAVPRVLLPDFDYGLKPNQLQQQAIYDDEQARARRAAMAKMGFAVVRQMPTTAHGGFRPVNAQGKPVSKPAAKTPMKLAARMAMPSTKPKPKVAAKPATKPLPKSRIVPTVRVIGTARVASAARAATTARVAAAKAKVTVKPAAKVVAKPAVTPASKKPTSTKK